MEIVYTLQVIDNDGTITGNTGSVIVQSRKIILDNDVSSYNEITRHHGILISKINDIQLDYGHSQYITYDDKIFQLCACASKPTACVKKENVIWVFERIQ